MSDLTWANVASSIEAAPTMLREHMDEHGLSYRAVAAEIGIAHSHLFRWLRGQQAIGADRLVKVLRWMEANCE